MRLDLLLTIGLLCFYASAGAQEETTILLDQGKYELDFSDLDQIKWHFDRNYSIVVKDNKDLDLLKNISIELNNEIEEKLTTANVVLNHADLTQDTVAQDSFKLQPYDALYSEYICHLADLRLHDTIKVSYTTRSEPHTSIIKWSIQQSYPVNQSVFQFLLPEGTVYHDHLTDNRFLTQELAIDTTLKFGRVRVPLKGLKLTFNRIPPLVDEPFAPEQTHRTPSVLLSIADLYIGKTELYMPPWPDQITDLAVSEYFGKQYRARAYYKWLADKAFEIISTRYTPRLHLLKLYEFVHQEFEWDGSYGLIPSHTLSEMQYEGKRVNKASMNMALLALLQEADFAAYPVLVTTTDQMPVYQEIPNLNQFTHFVIAVELDKEIFYMDAGDPLLPIGMVDNGVQHGQAILIKNYKGTWVNIPEFEAKSTIVIALNVEGDLSANGSITANFEGYDALNERHLLQADSKAMYWKDRGLALNPNIRIDSVRFDHVRNLLMPFENSVYFHIPASDDQEELAFHPIFYSFFNQLFFTDSNRVNPVIFPSRIVEKVVFNATLNDLTIKSIPSSIVIRTEDNASAMSFKTSDQADRLQCVFDITLAKAIDVQSYEALRKYLAQVYEKLTEPVVIGR